jgi:hypothetical protein
MTPGVRHLLPGINDMSPTAYNSRAAETTQLTPEKEAAFRQWIAANHITDLDAPESGYDYRGAFLAGEGRHGANGHFTDKFKQHGHETFSEESQYSNGANDGGHWNGDKFVPAPVEQRTAPAAMPGQVPNGTNAQASTEHPGWELTDPHGNVVHLRSDANKKRDADQVKALGDALLTHAVSEQEKAVAQRAIDWGMAQVGQADIGDIRKQMTHYWDTGTGGILKTDLQSMKSKANRGGKGGVPNPLDENGMPDPMGKRGHALDKDLNDRVSQVITQERAGGKYTALSDAENTLAQMEDALNSGNSMSERVAVQQQLLALTGKASRESEQAAITGAAGKWEELKNKMSLWTSNDPNLSRAYVAKFKGMIATQRSSIAKLKQQLAVQAATRMREQASGYPDPVASHAADIVYGSLSGNFRGGSYEPPAAPAASPAAPAADPYSGLD